MKSVGIKSLFLIFVVILLPVYWFAFRAPAVGIYHDDGIYLVTAKALAEGKGYRIISLPAELAQTKYPILFPAVLAVAWKIFPGFPDNALFLKTIPLLSAILWLWLSYNLIREESGAPDAALGIVLLTAASSWVVFFSTTFMSETFFACIATWALIQLKRLERDERGAGWPLLFSAMLVAASILTRTAGAPLVAAGTIGLLFRRKYTAAAMFLIACAVLVAPWLWWQALHGDPSRATDPYYTFSNYKSWTILWNFNPEQKYGVIVKNVLFLIVSPVALLNLNVNMISLIIAFLFVVFTCLGFIKDMRSNVGSLHLFILFYIGIIVLWVWPPLRFLLSIIPLFLLFAYKGFSSVCRSVFKSEKINGYISIVLFVILSVQMINGLLLSTKETIKWQAVSFMSRQDDWSATRELLDWIRWNTPQDSVLLGNLDPSYYLYTGRKAVRGFSADPYLLHYSNKPETALGGVPNLVQRMGTYQVTYVIRTPGLYFTEGKIFNGILDKMISDYPDSLRLVKKGSDPSYRVYEVDQRKLRNVLPSGLIQ
jgi:hypothetical protein